MLFMLEPCWIFHRKGIDSQNKGSMNQNRKGHCSPHRYNKKKKLDTVSEPGPVHSYESRSVVHGAKIDILGPKIPISSALWDP